MKKRLMTLAGVVVLCILLAIVSNVMAADANSPKGTPKEKSNDYKLVQGTVIVEKDNDGNITEIKVKATRDLIYQVVLDEKGKELGKTMNGKTARIEGPIEIKSNVHWLTVKTFSEPKGKSEAKPKPPNKPPANKVKPIQ